jgi:N-acetylneuraminic acid mutarotase
LYNYKKKEVKMRLFIVILLFPMLPQAITWTTRAPLPQPRIYPGCAVINDTVYIIGGSSGSGGTLHNTNYVYDPVSNSWSAKAPMPTARSNLNCAVVGGKIYAIGGFVGGLQADTNLVEEYDPVTNTWSTKTPMPTSRYCYAIAAVDGKIYVIGGMLPVTATVEEYDPVANSWATRAPMPTARMGPAAAVIRDTIYVFGGGTSPGSGETTINECYDPNTDNWASRANMTYARYCLGGFSYENVAYAIGGYDSPVYYNNVEVYDPATNSWSDETSMQYARQSIGVGLVGTKVYVIGGWSGASPGLTYNEEGALIIGIEEQQAVQNLRIDIGPNPFSKQTNISFGIEPRAEGIELKIYDATGRLVREWDYQTIGHSDQITWDGRDNSGKKVASGIYFIHAETDGRRAVEKVILIE